MDGFSAIREEKFVWGLFGLAVSAIVISIVNEFIGAILLGAFLYYATRTVRDSLSRRTDHPDVNAAAALLAVGIPLLLVLSYAAVVGIRELNSLLVTYQLQQYQTLLEPYISLPSLTRPATLIGFLRENADRLIGYVGRLFLWAGQFFVAIVVAFYLLRDDEKIATWFRQSVGNDHSTVRFLEGVDEDLDTVFTGNLLTVGITAVIAVGTFYAFDLVAPGQPTIQYPFLLGFLVGVFTFVPVVGMKAVWVPYAGYLFVRSLAWNQLPVWVPIGFVAVTFVIVDFLPDIFVRSYVSKGHINMGLMLLAYTMGVIVFGWYGLFLGPLVLVLFLHFAKRVFPNIVTRKSRRFVTK